MFGQDQKKCEMSGQFKLNCKNLPMLIRCGGQTLNNKGPSVIYVCVCVCVCMRYPVGFE